MTQKVLLKLCFITTKKFENVVKTYKEPTKKFSKTDITSGGVKNYMCLPKNSRAYQTRVVEDHAEPERTLPEKSRLVAKLRGIAGRGL